MNQLSDNHTSTSKSVMEAPENFGVPEVQSQSARWGIFLQQQLRLLTDLSGTIEKTILALANSDLITLIQHTHLLQDLVEAGQAQQWRTQRLSRGNFSSGTNQASDDEKWDEICTMLGNDALRVCALIRAKNHVLGALLRRSRRTTEIFSRLLVSSVRGDGTYVV